MTQQLTNRFVRERECAQITGLSRQRRWKMEKQGTFPKRINLGPRTIAWKLSELQQWIEDTAKAGYLANAK
ncbi:hypothetical protein AHAT_41610 [Agarivorans sp. Toyoura001]|uniref:helix-turn-helix transcriptional regulator n=1 Tax=Agarivorans sp. Toyoura001 TaxID=2283141 RepID=UPI0010E058E2|nr:AlpA family phage regulatory protein [Agarivorans sp. Toyoura001]GDY28271.1 hypothetical protein AHAT_41610 [Agarivorans sp. Toyoura001]